jgi:hypothetical protein
VRWKKYLPKNQGLCWIRKTEFLILDKVELRAKHLGAALLGRWRGSQTTNAVDSGVVEQRA